MAGVFSFPISSRINMRFTEGNGCVVLVGVLVGSGLCVSVLYRRVNGNDTSLS